MNKVLKWLGAFIFIAVIGIQSVSASSLNDESAMDTSNISIERQDSRNSVVPLNTPGRIEGINQHYAPWNTSLGWLRVGPWAGWDYAYMGSSGQTFTFVPTSNGRVVIRANSANWSTHRYFNISRRGYVYLDTRANAREFFLESFRETDNCTPNLCPNRIRLVITDVMTGQRVGVYRSGGFDYMTIGPGTRQTTWAFA